ncbi:MAG: hypothetical protein JWQ96_1900 [Segetibacter sp.]|nr:hypothetical protein [Segetibacter sp.]
METNNEQQSKSTQSTEESEAKDQTQMPEIPAMQDRAGNDLKEQHTERPTESGNLDNEANSSSNETIGTP